MRIIQKTKGFRFAIDAVLLAHFVSLKKKDKVIDLGTGTGVIPLILSTRLPQLDITAIDIQPQLIDMVQRTIELNKIENIKLLQGDLRELSSAYNGRFTVVTANPPYLPLDQGKPNVDLSIAISRHEMKCTLQELVYTAGRLLNNGGRFALVHRSERLGEIIREMDKVNIEPKRLRLIYPQKSKPANLLLLEGIKGAKKGLKVEEPLIIYDEQREYSKEVLDFYFGR